MTPVYTRETERFNRIKEQARHSKLVKYLRGDPLREDHPFSESR